MTTFTASEVRELAKHMESVGWRPDSKGDPECYDEGAARSAEILFAFADLLEARAKAVPVAEVCHGANVVTPFGKDGARIEVRWLKGANPKVGEKLYTHPAPADAERLAEALQPFANLFQALHASIPDDRPIYGINKAEITAGDLRRANEALTAHSAQAQPPAASVPDIETMVNRFLSWRLPKPWNPDNGISYTRPNYAHEPAEHDWPTGTNLFDAHQAREMIEYMLAAQENPNG